MTLSIMADHCYAECHYLEFRILLINLLNVVVLSECRYAEYCGANVQQS
jgi:hypothetical protein